MPSWRARSRRAARAVHANDRRRVVRALELAAIGSTLAPAEPVLWGGEPRHPTSIFGLSVPSEVVSERIARRARRMLEEGVEAEVRDALAGHTLSSTAARIHGLQDMTALVTGEIDRDEALRRLIARTRRYAKRQRTWMRRTPGLHAVAGPSEILAMIRP